MEYLEIKAPAKINLGLFILSKRDDGFHNLSTLFYPVCDLYDKLIFKKSYFPSFEYSGIKIDGEDKKNLILRAKDLLEKHTGKRLNLEIILEKNIPVGGGLGGGSSDAATALVSLNEFFSLGIAHDELYAIALELGSDVPFFIKPKPAVGSSRGEILKEIDIEINDFILIVNPRIHVSTREAFAGIKPKPTQIEYSLLFTGGKPDYNSFRRSLKNDFEETIFIKYPEIAKIKEKLYEDGAQFALMSGSGSTVFGIFNDLEKAEISMNSFDNNYFTFLSNRSD